MSGDYNFTGMTGKPTPCICPRCGIVHNVHMLWIGRGKPKVFCFPCKEYSHEVTGGLDEGCEFHPIPIGKRVQLA